MIIIIGRILILSEMLIKIGKNEKAIKQDFKELFQRIAFNIAVNNNDDHPRNHGVLFKDGTWSLSPLYDVVPMDSQTQSFSLAMEIGIDRRKSSKTNLLSAFKYFKLSEDEGAMLIDNESEIERFTNAMTSKP